MLAKIDGTFSFPIASKLQRSLAAQVDVKSRLVALEIWSSYLPPIRQVCVCDFLTHFCPVENKP